MTTAERRPYASVEERMDQFAMWFINNGGNRIWADRTPGQEIVRVMLAALTDAGFRIVPATAQNDDDHDRALLANPFTPDSNVGEAWMLGADWGSDQRDVLRDIIHDLQVQLEVLEPAHAAALADLGRCPTCRGKWPLYVGVYDGHGKTIRCNGCLRIPQECTCR